MTQKRAEYKVNWVWLKCGLGWRPRGLTDADSRSYSKISLVSMVQFPNNIFSTRESVRSIQVYNYVFYIIIVRRYYTPTCMCGNVRLPVFDVPSAVLTWQANLL